MQPAAVARCTSRHLEKCAAAQAETEARLAEYRKAKGTDVDNEALHADEIRAARDEYTQLMRFGDMRAATEALLPSVAAPFLRALRGEAPPAPAPTLWLPAPGDCRWSWRRMRCHAPAGFDNCKGSLKRLFAKDRKFCEFA